MGMLEYAASVHPKVQKLFDKETGMLQQPLNFTLYTNGLDKVSVYRLAFVFSRLQMGFNNREFDFNTRQSDLVLNVARTMALTPDEKSFYECLALAFSELIEGHSFDYAVKVWKKQSSDTDIEAIWHLTYALNAVHNLYSLNGVPTRIHLPDLKMLKEIINDGINQSFEEGYRQLEKSAGYPYSLIRQRDLIEEFDSVYCSIATA